MTFKRPALSSRLSSYSLDLALTYFLSFLFNPSSDLLMKLGEILLLGADFTLFELSVARGLALIFLTQIIRFYCVLFFGHTLFAPLFGLYPKEGFLWSRLGGSLRQILELVLFPVVLLQVILRPQENTICEKWTKTQLVQKRAGRLVWFGHFITPFVLVLSLYSPLFMNLTLFDGVVVVKEEYKAEALRAETSFDQFKLYRSQRYRMESLSHLDNERFVLLPDYDFRRSSGQLRIVPFVKVLDRAQQRVGQFKVGPELRWAPIILRSRDGMPLWSTHFKELDKSFQSFSPEALRGNTTEKLSPESCADLQKLLKNSFELGGKNLIDHTLESGPFIRGLIQLRSVLLEIVDPTSAPQVDLITLGEYPFLRFRQILEFSEEDFNSRHTLFPLCMTRAPYYELNFKSDLASSKSRKEFMDVFLTKAKWDFVDFQKEDIPKRRQDFHLFHLIDGLMDTQLTEDQRLSLEEGASYYLFNLGHQSFNDPALYDELLSSIAKIQELVALMEKRDETVFTKSFLFYIEKLQLALINKNADYFAAEIKGL